MVDSLYINSVLWFVGFCYVCQLSVKILVTAISSFRSHVWAQIMAKYTDRNLPRTYGRWAVVTGSTDGIGKAYARELAKAGHDIVLISRTMEKLQRVAQEIRKDFGVQTEVIQADYTKGRPLYEEISRQLEGKEIGILVNNVGVMNKEPHVFEKLCEEFLWDLVNVNVASVPAMTQLVLPAMLERGRGAIINIASVAGLLPIPLLEVYSATKAFVDFFTRALQFEYRSSGLTIQTVLPSAVKTNLSSFNEDYRTESLFVPSPDSFAAHALATLGYTGHTTGFWSHGLQTWLTQCLPEYLAMYGVESHIQDSLKKSKKAA